MVFFPPVNLTIRFSSFPSTVSVYLVTGTNIMLLVFSLDGERIAVICPSAFGKKIINFFCDWT